MGQEASRTRWRIVLAREVGESSRFVYAVKTTGIYCRPGCPARTPKRGNVVFFERSQDAEVAGYRACKRCRPDKVAARGKEDQ